MSGEIRARRTIVYAQTKFAVGSFAYLTPEAYKNDCKAVEGIINVGPYQVSSISLQGVEVLMSFRDLNRPPWSTTSYLQDCTDIEDWLTEEEYFIQQKREVKNQSVLWAPEVGQKINVSTNASNHFTLNHSLEFRGDFGFVLCEVIEIDECDYYDIRKLPRLIVRALGHKANKSDPIVNIDPLLCY